MREQKTYPKGTTKEQWDAYEKDMKDHEQHISRRKDDLKRILFVLNYYGQRKATWTLSEIDQLISSDIDMASSFDAPNKPGSMFSNND